MSAGAQAPRTRGLAVLPYQRPWSKVSKRTSSFVQKEAKGVVFSSPRDTIDCVPSNIGTQLLYMT